LYLLLLLDWTLSFSATVRPIDKVPICLSIEEASVQGGHEVLKEVDDNGALIVANPQGILGRQWPVL
jgi:hypothetical protein